jgi:hypothetical protein
MSDAGAVAAPGRALAAPTGPRPVGATLGAP